jgi:hypothetical protein
MIYVVKEALDVCIHYPAIPTAMKSLAEFKGGALRPPAPAITVAAGQEVLLKYGRQYQGCPCLHHLVPYHRDTEGTTPSGLGYVTSAY